MNYSKNISKLVLLLVVAVFIFGISFSVQASNQKLSGYIYSKNAGWISLNCSNTASCAKIDYSASVDASGKVFGYGFSQSGGWINFNPTYGGISIDSANGLSGWAFAEKSGWVRIDGVKTISASDLQNQIAAAKGLINSNNLSSASTMSVLNSLCLRFLPKSDCDKINTK